VTKHTKDIRLMGRVREHHLALTGEHLPDCHIVMHGCVIGGTAKVLFQALRTPPAKNLPPIDSALTLATYLVCDCCSGIDPCDVTMTGDGKAIIRRNPNDCHRH
jgi:hypothetical protein